MTGKTWHKSKADWAAAMAASKRELVKELRFAPTAGQPDSKKRDKWRRVRLAEAEAQRYEQLERKFRQAGQ